ncbi:MAG: PIN/TRAM domain-containing protein [Planctomycetaceae bacterium]
MQLIIFRGVFLVVTLGIATIAATLASNYGPTTFFQSWLPLVAFFGTMLLGGGIIALDLLIPRKRIEIASGLYFGLLVGMALTYVMQLAMEPLITRLSVEGTQALTLIMGMVLCYASMTILLQTMDDFRFIIPYVEFSKETKGLKPLILDTSVVIDGRIADLVQTNVLDNQLIMPRFVLAELQAVADSSDKLRRARGRRGLDILNRLRSAEGIDLKIHDRELPEMADQPVDMKLVLLAKHLDGKVVTGDYNLNKVARIHNVPVINLNDIANALKPVYLPGEQFMVRIVKPGEELGQGVGYLEDGTMIVVEGGRDHIGKEIKISVTSVLQTSAGRMIFGRFAT